MTTSGLVRAVHVSLLGVSLATLAPPGAAQLIQIRTVPFAQGDQFSIFPSNNLGMGGVSITVPDTLLDPFTNPAKGARLAGGRFFSAPTVRSVTRRGRGADASARDHRDRRTLVRRAGARVAAGRREPDALLLGTRAPGPIERRADGGRRGAQPP